MKNDALDNLDQDNRQRLQLLGMLAMELIHDIANPLNYIKGSAAALQMNLNELMLAKGTVDSPGLQEVMSESIQLSHAIELGARQCGKLIDTIRQFGKASHFVSDVLLSRVVEDCKAILHYRLSQGIQFQQEVAGNLMVRGHEVHFHQMIMNLVVNAVHAIQGKKERSPKDFVRVTGVEEDGFARLTVEDSGGGMPQEVVDQLFKPTSLHSSGGKGLGLGLSIVHKLATDYGGKIEVVSQSGMGTQCTLRLPLV